MLVDDNIVIYINVKKYKSTKKRSRDATKGILGGLLLGGTIDFCFRISNIFSLNGRPVSYPEFFL